jgi:hypothetical protein
MEIGVHGSTHLNGRFLLAFPYIYGAEFHGAIFHVFHAQICNNWLKMPMKPMVKRSNNPR